MATKKNYTITVKSSNSAAVIAVDHGASNYYPYQHNYTYLEVSCDIDKKTFSPKFDYKGIAEEWHYRLMRNENDSLANWQGENDAIRYTSELAIEDAKKAIRKAIKSLKVTHKNGKSHPAYTAMKAQADSTIRHYEDDFYHHDTLVLGTLAQSARFIWMVRDTGTWIITKQGDFSREIIKQESKEKQHKLFVWTGSTLKCVDFGEMSAFYNNIPRD